MSNNDRTATFAVSRVNLSAGMAGAIQAFLKDAGLVPLDDGHWDSTPDVLVVSQNLAGHGKGGEIEKAADRLRVFTATMPGLVLCLDAGFPFTAQRIDPDRIFIFGNRKIDRFDELRQWLAQRPSNGSTGPRVEAKALVKAALVNIFGPQSVERGDVEWPKLMEKVVRFASENFKLTTAGSANNSLSNIHWLEFLHILLHVSGRYDALEHDLNAQGQHWFDVAPMPPVPAGKNLDHDAQGQNNKSTETPDDRRLNAAKMRALLHTAEDVVTSLLEADYLQRPPTILLVDDAPLKIKEELCGVLDAFMPRQYRLWHWNPAMDNGIWLDRLVSYDSLSDREWATQSVSIDLWRGGDPKPSTIAGLLAESDFVLVDLLYRVKDQDQSKGAELVRGLRRLSVDTQGKSPSFLMLSRADDTAKVQHALRAGANGYVLKNRLLSLPAELARLRGGNMLIGSQLHRNFRALDALPNETKGLLHEVTIPKMRFDRAHDQGALKEDSPKQQMARLLRALPKPDLHLHVGSCMTPEFLVVASILMLAERHAKMKISRVSPGSNESNTARTPLLDAIPPLFSFWSGKAKLRLQRYSGDRAAMFESCFILTQENPDPVDLLGKRIRQSLMEEVQREAKAKTKKMGTITLRSVLHASLGIRDHWSGDKVCEELGKKDVVTLMFFALTNGEIAWRDPKPWTCGGRIEKNDVLRLFILFLATEYEGGDPRIVIEGEDFLKPLREVRRALTDEKTSNLDLSMEGLDKRLESIVVREGDNVVRIKNDPALDVSLGSFRGDMLFPCPKTYREAPLEFLIASGTRGRTLAEYLAGCEYAGAEHLQRPLLMKLYARQTLEYLVRHGVLYAEMRSAVSGYASKDKDKDGMTYQEACTAFQEAFSKEQKEMLIAYRKVASKSRDVGEPKPVRKNENWAWCTGGKSEDLWPRVFESAPSAKTLDRLFPAKVNLIFTGKRHKATREMLIEAAAGVISNSESKSDFISASAFSDENMQRCRVVGFDLAGLEESFPPEMFRAQFEQLSRMHIPITAHAGENASAHFVESAVLDLRARRLGHGLALADDEKLMARVREERICIELCPVSNYQTNEFAEAKPGREYPLKKFLQFGNIVCLNTDNPIVSYTNIVKEFFQASYAYAPADKDENGKAGPGLSLWDALRMIRMGFASAFKGLAERRALIELAEQMIFDLLTDTAVNDLLRKLANRQPS